MPNMPFLSKWILKQPYHPLRKTPNHYSIPQNEQSYSIPQNKQSFSIPQNKQSYSIPQNERPLFAKNWNSIPDSVILNQHKAPSSELTHNSCEGVRAVAWWRHQGKPEAVLSTNWLLLEVVVAKVRRKPVSLQTKIPKNSEAGKQKWLHFVFR